MDQPDRNAPTGPLKFPLSLRPPTKEAARALQKLNLQPHCTAQNWLPEDGFGFPALAELRAEVLRLRGQVADEIAALAELDQRVAAEEREHNEKLRQGMLDGNVAAVEDRRTPDQQQRGAIVERLCAGVVVLADATDKVVEWFRDHESDLFAERLSRLAPLVEEEREAREAHAQARRKMWELAQYGPYIKRLADDGAFGRQQVPTAAEPPPGFDAERARQMLERPWHETKPWIAEPPMETWQDSGEPEAEVETLASEDETGQVSELVESGAGS